MSTCDPKAGGGGEGVGAESCPVGSSDNLCWRNRISSGSVGEEASLHCVEDAREREIKVKNERVRTRMRWWTHHRDNRDLERLQHQRPKEKEKCHLEK